MDLTTIDAGVRDDRETRRFELDDCGTTATLEYRRERRRLVLVRTHVPPSIDGPDHRVGGRLLRAAIARAKADHVTLVPSCPFARRWLRDHPDAAVGVAIDWSAVDGWQR